MQNQVTKLEATSQEPEATDFDQFTSYEDGNDFVICDRTNPKAWIKSDTTTRID